MLPMYLKAISSQSTEKSQPAIVSEKFAIATCGVAIATVAIPLLVFIQALVALVWGPTTVFQLLNGRGLFDQ
jgi:hypothetical protein